MTDKWAQIYLWEVDLLSGGTVRQENLDLHMDKIYERFGPALRIRLVPQKEGFEEVGIDIPAEAVPVYFRREFVPINGARPIPSPFCIGWKRDGVKHLRAVCSRTGKEHRMPCEPYSPYHWMLMKKDGEQITDASGVDINPAMVVGVDPEFISIEFFADGWPTVGFQIFPGISLIRQMHIWSDLIEWAAAKPGEKRPNTRRFAEILGYRLPNGFKVLNYVNYQTRKVRLAHGD